MYARLSRSTTQLALSQRDLLGVTETVSQALVVSGSTAQEASAAMIQLGQALASNRLQGDEFRSLSEQAPALTRAIAAELGITLGELRQFSRDGKLTTQVLVEALQGAAPKIAAAFERMEVSVSRRLQNLGTALTRFFDNLGGQSGARSAAGGIFGGLTNAVNALNRNLPEVINTFKSLAAALVAVGAGNLALKSIRQELDALNKSIGRHTIVNALAASGVAAAKLFGILPGLWKRLGTLSFVLRGVGGALVGIATLVYKLINAGINWAAYWDVLKDKVGQWADAFTVAFPKIAAFFKGLTNIFSLAFRAWDELLSEWSESIVEKLEENPVYKQSIINQRHAQHAAERRNAVLRLAQNNYGGSVIVSEEAKALSKLKEEYEAFAKTLEKAREPARDYLTTLSELNRFLKGGAIDAG